MGIQELLRHVDLEALRDDTQELRAALADVLAGVRCAVQDALEVGEDGVECFEGARRKLSRDDLKQNCILCRCVRNEEAFARKKRATNARLYFVRDKQSKNGRAARVRKTECTRDVSCRQKHVATQRRSWGEAAYDKSE